MPTACAAIPMRPPVSAVIAWVKPAPSPPSSALPGTRTPSKARSQVLLVWMPSFSVTFSTRTPSSALSMRNALMPLAPGPPVRNIPIITPE